MGRKTVLVDDYDGKELPDDTKPITLSLGRSSYDLYLSEKNHGKLLDVLTPFIENAEATNISARITRSVAVQGVGDKERNRAVRAWAIETGYKFTNAAGEEVTLGERGRIPQDVYDAYDKAN